MMKKILIWLLALVMCISLVPSFAEDEDPLYESAFTADVYNIDTWQFDLAGVANNFKENNEDANFTYIMFTEVTEGGTLKYSKPGSKDVKVLVNGSEKYYKSASTSSSKDLSYVNFVPDPNYTGEVRISYNGYTTDRKTLSGMIVINVKDVAQTGELEMIPISAEQGEAVKLDSSTISDVCENEGFDDDEVKYIKFTLPKKETEGTLYLNYVASNKSNTSVSASKYYYMDDASSSAVDKITLVVAESAENVFYIPFEVYKSSSSGSKAITNGAFVILIKEYGGKDASYTVTGESIKFVARDFLDDCDEATGGKTLEYVKFKTPSEGSLWYDYDDEYGDRASVSSTKQYYYSGKSGELRISRVSYVPKANSEKTVFIEYDGFTTSNESYKGTVVIYVNTKSEGEAEDVKLSSVKSNATRTISSSSINDKCKKLTGEELDYIKFTSTTGGTLYYKYSKSGDNDKVTSSSRYYYKGEGKELISSVTFVPKSNKDMTATIEYTGYTTGEKRFTGEIKIPVTAVNVVKKDEDTLAPIKYQGEIGKAVKFDPEDFSETCYDFCEDDLDYIFFNIPDDKDGVLYYDYGGNGQEKVSKSKDYYYDEDEELLISEISFVPARSGNITIEYAAATMGYDEFKGTIVIKVASKEGMNNFKYQRTYSNDMFPDVDENAWYGAKQTEAVKLAYRYGLMSGRADGTFDPAGSMTVAEALTIAARVHDIYYDNGTEFEAGKTWYEEYVSYAINEKIINKNDFENYDKAITREEMAYIFANIIPEDAMEEINEVYEIPDVTEDDEYYDEIIYLYNVGVLSGSDSRGTFNPKSNISRAEVSAIIVRVVAPEERRENEF